MMIASDKIQTPDSVSFTSKITRFLFCGWIQVFNDLQTFVSVLQNRVQRSRINLVLILLSIVITWFIYVPIHELLHVAGCVVSGGTVTTLIMGKEYGAEFLKNFFPFIVPQTSQYAGRLTGFKPNGDLGYLLTDFAPFIISVFPGILLLQVAKTKAMIRLAGPGLVIGLAPFLNLTGDYFEMGTIISTRLIDWITSGSTARLIPNFWELRSDDIFRLFSEIAAAPENYGINASTGLISTSFVILIGAFLAVVFCGWTYTIGRKISSVITKAESDSC